MNISVFYFSGTGNTKWAVNNFKNAVADKGHECQLYSIEKDIEDIQKKIKESDYVGFAFPIYGQNMPAIMSQFICDLEKTLEKQVFVITTSGFIDAFGPFTAKKVLRNTKFGLCAYLSLSISNNLSTPKVKAKFKTGKDLEKNMYKAINKMNVLINKLINKEQYITNIGPYLIPGMVIRKLLSKKVKNGYLELSINSEKCIHCNFCLNNCPTKSIIYSDGEYTFLPTCTSCMRCYNLCPNNAVYHVGKYADPQIYKRYRGPEAKV